MGSHTLTQIDARARTHTGMQAMWCGACTFKSCLLSSEVESSSDNERGPSAQAASLWVPAKHAGRDSDPCSAGRGNPTHSLSTAHQPVRQHQEQWSAVCVLLQEGRCFASLLCQDDLSVNNFFHCAMQLCSTFELIHNIAPNSLL